MNVERSPQFRAVARRVLRWTAVYTRGLDAGISADRMDEIASDLHEHAAWAAETGLSPSALARSVRRRALFGAAADLAWRHQQVRGADPFVRFALRADAALTTATAMTGLLLTGLGLFTIVRVIRALLIGDIGFVPGATFSIAVLTVLSAIATALLFRSRLRAAGAALLIPSCLLMLPTAGSVLWLVSASTVFVFAAAPWWQTAAMVAGGGLALVCAASAVHWFDLPRHRTAGRRKERSHA